MNKYGKLRNGIVVRYEDPNVAGEWVRCAYVPRGYVDDDGYSWETGEVMYLLKDGTGGEFGIDFDIVEFDYIPTAEEVSDES